ncbi:hypothetical protein C7974DRAFT_379504 [Boeremia exigua]|uniref:uncharacterized protein n=1 Tax=Boeremia exigua TaxID=749465 RepID=UPI001E8EB3BC|nr:uncharacterized protein C7974DRAFT_379504 [Boeremia exigua]KAH6616632.1 hypothetical protein C7974DRAFT_379504 [Boeremia exigua]
MSPKVEGVGCPPTKGKQTSGEGCDLTATTVLGPCGERLSRPATHRCMQALNRSIHCAPEAHHHLGSGSKATGNNKISGTEWSSDLRRPHASNGGCAEPVIDLMRRHIVCQHCHDNRRTNTEPLARQKVIWHRQQPAVSVFEPAAHDMIVGPFAHRLPFATLACGKPSLADLCSCTDDAGGQKKKKKTMQVLRRLPRLRMSRNLAPALVEAGPPPPPCRQARSYLANGLAIRDDGSPFVARSWAPSTPSL